MEGIQSGDKVRHNEYGTGKVTKAPKDVSNEKMVRFEGLDTEGINAHSGIWVMVYDLTKIE